MQQLDQGNAGVDALHAQHRPHFRDSLHLLVQGYRHEVSEIGHRLHFSLRLSFQPQDYAHGRWVRATTGTSRPPPAPTCSVRAGPRRPGAANFGGGVGAGSASNGERERRTKKKEEERHCHVGLGVNPSFHVSLNSTEMEKRGEGGGMALKT